MTEGPSIARLGDDADPLVRALVAAAPLVPASFTTFERIARTHDLVPDFTEHSVAFGRALAPHRITHYFDVPRFDHERVRATAARFVSITDALGHPLTEIARTLIVEWLATQRCVAQVVLGIDARADEETTRSKLYVVLRETAPAFVESICERLDVAVPSNLDPREVYIVGIDVNRGGVEDLKVYMRLDMRRLHRSVRNLADVRALAEGARSVVLQQCLGERPRRQLHFHAEDDRVYAAWLVGRAAESDSIASLIVHANAVAARIGRGRLGPWIVGLGYHEGTLSTSQGNVYFHVSEPAR